MLTHSASTADAIATICSCVIRSPSATVLFARPTADMIFEMSKTASEPFRLMIFIARTLSL